MLVRIYIKNLFSFGEETEFNMIPNKRYTRFNEHRYEFDNINVLKMTSLYGANAAGKSNLVSALTLLQNIITKENIPLDIGRLKFRFNEKNEPIVLVIEFISNGKCYIYGLEIESSKIITEELYLSGCGKKKDVLIFERNIGEDDLPAINFSENFLKNKENKVLKKIIEDNFLKQNKSILKFLSGLKNNDLSDVTNVFDWFSKKLNIIRPGDKPIAITHQIDINNEFKKYANDIMCSFNVGINNLNTIKIPAEEYFGTNYEDDLKEIIEKFEDSSRQIVGLRSNKGEELIIVKEDEKFYVKKLEIEHKTILGSSKTFNLEEESDGTIRLLDFVPAFKTLLNTDSVFIVDEIERSIHPLMVKELVKKFSFDTQTKGQLIFTTHETNLLDQNIFRQDEIWFVEKDTTASTRIYSLSDYKDHHTKDIRKGYLTGRYGSIPFLANLQDLNWQEYDFKE